MKTEEWFERAIAYFNGTMSTEEAQHFEKESAADNELSKLMELWISTDEDATLYEQNKEEADALIKTHQKLKGDFVIGNNKTLTIKYPIWKWVSIAAAVTGIVVLMTIFISPSKDKPLAERKVNSDPFKKAGRRDSIANTDNQITKKDIQPRILYAQNFEPDEIPEDPNGPLDNAFFYYAAKQYNNAITAIDSAGSKALTRGNDSFTPLTTFYAVYYKALSMLMINDDGGAITNLTQAAALAPHSYYKTKAQWYLALAYLKQEDIASAENVLRDVANNPSAGAFKGKAESLLDTLNK